MEAKNHRSERHYRESMGKKKQTNNEKKTQMAARANTAEAQGLRERAEGMEGHRELALKHRQGKISKGAERESGEKNDWGNNNPSPTRNPYPQGKSQIHQNRSGKGRS